MALETVAVLAERRRFVRYQGSAHLVGQIKSQGETVGRDAQVKVLDISARGMAVLSTSEVDAGDTILVNISPQEAELAGGRTAFEFEVLQCTAWHDGRFKWRCQLIDGTLPATLVFSW